MDIQSTISKIWNMNSEEQVKVIKQKSEEGEDENREAQVRKKQ